MATTMEYINQLKQDKNNLVNQLTEHGIEANDTETFTELIPKIANIGGGSKITPSSISFKNCVATEDFSKSMENIDFSQITDAAQMFYGVKGADILDLSKSKFGTLENMVSMFYETSFKKIILPEINFKHLESNKFDLGDMFSNNIDTEYIDLSKLKIDSKTLTFQAMFHNFGQNCENPTLIFPNINFDSTQTKEINFYYMFENCTTIKKIDLSKWLIDNENCTINSYGMFYNCQELEELDLSGIKTSKFHILTSYSDNFGTFKNCLKLKRLDIRNLIITEETAPKTLEEIPLDCKIIVKDEETKTLLKSKLSVYTNIITPEEDV